MCQIDVSRKDGGAKGLYYHHGTRRPKMTPVGFEPTQLALVELESTPLDHSGKVSLISRSKLVTCGYFLSLWDARGLEAHRSDSTSFSMIFRSFRWLSQFTLSLRFRSVFSVSGLSLALIIRILAAYPYCFLCFWPFAGSADVLGISHQRSILVLKPVSCPAR